MRTIRLIFLIITALLCSSGEVYSVQTNREYSQYSPFNTYASHPPVLRDKNGKFYGYFTCNKYKSKRANYELIDIICDNHEEIREDVGDWYDKIF